MSNEYKPPMYRNVEQTAQIGDLVRVKCGFWGEENSEYIGQLAVVEYTYASKYPGMCTGDRTYHQLSLKFEDGGGSAWWSAEALEFIAHDKLEMVGVWNRQYTRKLAKLKSYDFIAKFAIDRTPKEFINELPAECLSFIWEQAVPGVSMWGSRGEGFTLVQNQILVRKSLAYARMAERAPVTKRNWRYFRKILVIMTNAFKKSVSEAGE